MGNEVLAIASGLLGAIVTYSIGRIDGYWKGVEDTRRQEAEIRSKVNGGQPQ